MTICTMHIHSIKKNNITKESLWIGPLGDMKEFNYPIHFKPAPIEHKDRDEMNIWCEENCNGLYYGESYSFWFQDEQDAMAFKLRWL